MTHEEARELVKMGGAKAVALPGFDGEGGNYQISRSEDGQIKITKTPLTPEQRDWIARTKNS